ARLSEPIPESVPVSVAAQPPAAGDVVRAVGYGRTASEWVPNTAHVADFSVESVDDATLDILGITDEASICQGDAGGPVLRITEAGPELVALNSTSWQHGCLGENSEQRGATSTRTDDINRWIAVVSSRVELFRYADATGAHFTGTEDLPAP